MISDTLPEKKAKPAKVRRLCTQHYKQINVSVTLLEKLNWIRKSFKHLHSRKFSAVFRNFQAERWLEKGEIFLNLAVQSSKLQLHLNYRGNAHLWRLSRLGNATRKRLQSSLNFFACKLNSVLHFIFTI